MALSSELAASLQKLDAELDKLAPSREKATYAYIKNKAGIACQLYINPGEINLDNLAELLRIRAQTGKENRLAYLWLNDKIASPKSSWNWREAPAQVDSLLIELRQASNAWRNVASWELSGELVNNFVPKVEVKAEAPVEDKPLPAKKTTKRKAKK